MAAEPTTRDAGAAASASPAPTPPSAPMPLEAPKIPAGGPWQGPTQAPPPAVPKLEAPPPTMSTPAGDARVGTMPPTTVPGTASQPVSKPTKPSSHANRAKNVALTALTGGSIGLPAQETPAPGFLPAGGGNRKVIPELVLPFPLPCEDTVVASEATMDMDSSVVCLQALRQTRMMHMLQILPPYSHRQRAGMEFYEVVPPSLLPGIHPRSAHTLLSLGRADVHVGPMTYYGVRFWHLRPAPAPTMPRVQRPVRPPEAGRPPMAHGPGPQTAAHVRPHGPSGPAQVHAPGPTPQGAGPGSFSEAPRPPPATAAPSTQSSQPQPQPQPQGHPPQPQAQPPPPLDAGFVARLQQRAERDPHLQHLLQLARTGQLPEQGMVQLNAILASLVTPPVPPPEERAPPVVLVEFPENPSLQLVLPLWHAAVERTHATGQASSVVLSFFAPAIGSKAAGESGKEEAQAAVHGMLVRHMSHVSSAPPPAAAPAPTKEEADPAAAPAAAPAPKRRRTGARGKNVKAEQAAPDATAAPPTRNHELFPLTWRITSEQGVDERLWDCLGRVPGCLTNGAWASPGDERVFAAIKASFAQRKRTMPALHRLPPRLSATDIPPGLVDHVQDRYAMRMAVHTHRPQPKRKVAMLSDTKEANHARSMEPALRAPVIGEDGVKPKRKRHVATHNPDGSLKSCGACGKTKTPMWRRGPKGPSQLCNACGAKWKAGRLVVPEVPPPPILNDVLPVRHVKPPIASMPPMMPVPQVPSSLSGGIPAPRQNAPPGHPTPMPATTHLEVRPPSGEAATSAPLSHMALGAAASEPRYEVHAPAEAPATAPPPPGKSTPTPPAP